MSSIRSSDSASIEERIVQAGMQDQLEKTALIPISVFSWLGGKAQLAEPWVQGRIFNRKVNKRKEQILRDHPRMYPANAEILAMWDVAEMEGITIRKGKPVFKGSK